MKKIMCLIVILCCSASPVLAKKAVHNERGAAEQTLIPALPPIILNYDVYVGGIHLIESKVLFEEQKGKYHARVNARTYGFWHKVLPWDTVLDVRGLLKRQSFAPQEFTMRDEWNHVPKTTKLHFTKAGDVTPEFDPPSHDENREIVTKVQRLGSLDPVTALLQLLAHIGINKSCATTVPVFDGKRRFNVTGVDKGTEYIDEEDYGIFKGDARVCTAEFAMIAGEWKDRKPSKFWQKSETENGRDPFHVYIAPVGPNKAELAIRLESSSVFGLIIGHLTSWHYASAEEMK